MRTLLLLAALAVPLDPVTGVIDAFRTHRVIALGEGSHGNFQAHAFRLALVRDPRFAAAVQDIVVEFGSARHQDLMDRFVNGAGIPDDTLRRAWIDTTQPDAIWDTPIYEEFFRAVRAVNAALPRERRLRVLLGDPPIDWDVVRTREDLDRFASKRDEHAADLIRRETLARGRRALVLYGDYHFARTNAGGIVARLESGGERVFAIHTETRADLKTKHPEVGEWKIPSLSLLRGTDLGPADQFDAVLYLGPPSGITFSRISAALCADGPYMKMRLRRMALVPPPPGAPMPPIERLKEHCAQILRTGPQ
jgi:erythromycin esterase-like protein